MSMFFFGFCFDILYNVSDEITVFIYIYLIILYFILKHTQTHSTRFVALTADAKRKPISSSTIPLSVPHHAVIKIEDCGNGGSGTTHHHHQQHQHQQSQPTSATTAAALFEEDKTHNSINSINASSTSTIAAAAQTSDISSNIPAQIFYHQPSGGLIQIAHQNSQSNSVTECRSVANETSPSLLMPQIISTSSPQLTSLNESSATGGTITAATAAGITTDGLEAAKTCVPDVQDATIQTDTPVMSEDDNTCSAEDCLLPNQQIEEEKDVVIPSSTTLSEHLSPPLACHNVSTNVIEEEKETTLGNTDTDSSKNDSGFGSNAVTSTNSLEEPSSITEEINSNNVTANIEDEQFVAPYNLPSIEKGPENSSTPVDLSGLELLSNISIEASEKKVTYIKKEPIEEKKNTTFERIEEINLNEHLESNMRKENDDKHLMSSENEKFVSDQNEQLGGLNLLCALAEQRIQEEVGRRHRKRSSSSDSRSSKKKKHKHSKSGKKSRHDKEKKEKKRHRDSREYEDIVETGSGVDITIQKEVLQEDLKETLDRIKANYMKSNVCKNESIPHCCREKCNWPTPEELLSAMEKDMRLRLADITRQCQEKKKELEEIAPILQHRKSQLFPDRESTPFSSKNSVKSFYSERQQQQQQQAQSQQQDIKINNHQVSSPKWYSTEIIQTPEDTQKTQSDTESCKLDDIETSSTSSSRRKGNVPKKHDDNNTETIVAKKSKNLVGCILTSKNRFNEIKDKNVFDSAGLLTDETSLLSENSCKIQLKSETLETIKQDNYENLSGKSSTEISTVSTNGGLFDNNREKRYHRKSSKHHSKHKKSKSNKEKKHHRSSEIKERKRKIDVRCLITTELLDRLENNKIRVLTAMGGLFYAGSLTALEPPDIYSVTLDGERGNRPHIMTREDVLRDAVIEIKIKIFFFFLF